MYYELYIDSLFLVNFVMNLYLLLLVNRSAFCTATRLRLVLGAGVGAILYLMPFLWSGAGGMKLVVGLVIGTVGMLFSTFRIRSLGAFFRLLEKLLLYSFLMGGILLFLIRRVPFLRSCMTGIFGLMGMGAMVYLLLSRVQEQRREQEKFCFVTLICEEGSMRVAALIDSGNSLVEPISGKPVSIVEKSTLKGLWGREPELYRAIPYHSIGKNRGILRGYLLPELQIEVNGVVKTCKDVYVAVSEEAISGEEVRMILNPALLGKGT